MMSWAVTRSLNGGINGLASRLQFRLFLNQRLVRSGRRAGQSPVTGGDLG